MPVTEPMPVAKGMTLLHLALPDFSQPLESSPAHPRPGDSGKSPGPHSALCPPVGLRSQVSSIRFWLLGLETCPDFILRSTGLRSCLSLGFPSCLHPISLQLQGTYTLHQSHSVGNFRLGQLVDFNSLGEEDTVVEYKDHFPLASPTSHKNNHYDYDLHKGKDRCILHHSISTQFLRQVLGLFVDRMLNPGMVTLYPLTSIFSQQKQQPEMMSAHVFWRQTITPEEQGKPQFLLVKNKRFLTQLEWSLKRQQWPSGSTQQKLQTSAAREESPNRTGACWPPHPGLQVTRTPPPSASHWLNPASSGDIGTWETQPPDD
ncbi:uncharacterized protein [Vicugna pacos]|uniref:Uncharacterized protein n=1 Tax=Vicugna pacos TaxID=30538 RepID=A0ABM5DXZ1_VICPA